MSNGIKVTPLDIQQKRFHVGFRGYEQTEVNMFLDLVRDQMEELIREVTDLREFRQVYDERRRELIEKEETVKNAMLLTQKLVDDQKENSRKESALMVKDAEMRIQQMMLNAQQEKMQLEAEILELKRKKHHFLEDVKKVVQMHLEMVRYEEGADEIKVEPLN